MLQRDEGSHTERERRTNLAEPEYLDAVKKFEPASEDDDLEDMYSELRKIDHLAKSPSGSHPETLAGETASLQRGP